MIDAGISCTHKGELGSYYILMDFNNQPKAAALRAKYETTDKSKDIGEWVFGMMLEESGCALLHASAFGLPHDELF